jgi:cytochrome c-type biogenesis protein CcsB
MMSPELVQWENTLFYLTFAAYGLASFFYIGYLASRNLVVGNFATYLTMTGVATNTIALGLRWYVSGHAPLANGYEFLLAFALGIAAVYLVAEAKFKIKAMGTFVVPFAWLVLAFVALLMPNEQKLANNLMPALQSNWLTIHVFTAMLAYGAFAVSSGIAIVYLWKEAMVNNNSKSAFNSLFPNLDTLDQLSYRVIAFAFPLLSLCIITGAIWAEYAWGHYWSWDPKETWSLITWFVYAAYLHARFTFGWRGRRAALMAVIGFVTVLFTFFGVNYFLSGLHSYAKAS